MKHADNSRVDGLAKLLSSRTVCEVLDISDRNLRRLVAGGKFSPADLHLGRSLRWKASTVRTFLDDGNA